MTKPYATGLERNEANYTPLTPVSFLAKAAYVYPGPGRGHPRRAAAPVEGRLRALAAGSPRRSRGRGVGARRHRGRDAPQRSRDGGAALRPGDDRRGAQYPQHAPGRARPSPSCSTTARRRCSSPTASSPRRSRRRSRSRKSRPLVIDVDDAMHEGGEAPRREGVRGVPRRRATRTSRGRFPPDEWDAIALNYTSGTTGNPKGVVYHYRGAYLNAINNILDWSMPKHAGLPVDAADVPLQRLVLQLDDRRGGRHQRVPAQGGREG